MEGRRDGEGVRRGGMERGWRRGSGDGGEGEGGGHKRGGEEVKVEERRITYVKRSGGGVRRVCLRQQYS